MNYQYYPLVKDSGAVKNKSKLHGIHDLTINFYTPFDLLERGKILIVTTVENFIIDTKAHMITNSTNMSLFGTVEVSSLFFQVPKSSNIMTHIYPTDFRKFLRSERSLQYVLHLHYFARNQTAGSSRL